MRLAFRSNFDFSHLTVYVMLVGTASRRLHGKYYRDHQKNLDHKFPMKALVSLSLSLRDAVFRSLRTIRTMVTWTMSSSVPRTSRSVSSLPRCVETAVRLQGATVCTREGPVIRREIPNPHTISLALLVNQTNSFGAAPLISLVDLDVESARNMEYAFIRDVNDCKISEETFNGVEFWVCFLGFKSAKGSRVTCSHFQLRDGATDVCRHKWTLCHRGVATTYASGCIPQREMSHFTAMWSQGYVGDTCSCWCPGRDRGTI